MLKKKINLLKYFPVLLCLLIAISISEPSSKKTAYTPYDGPVYIAGMENYVEKELDAVVTGTVIGKEKIFIFRSEKTPTELFGTAYLVKVKDKLYDTTGIFHYVYVFEIGNSRSMFLYSPPNGGLLRKGEKLLLYLSEELFFADYLVERIPSSLKYNYPIFMQVNNGYSARVVHSDGTLSLRDGNELKSPAYGHFRTVDEARAYFSDFCSENLE